MNARDQSEKVLRDNELRQHPLSLEAPGHRAGGSAVQSLSSIDAMMLAPSLLHVIHAWPFLSRESKDIIGSIVKRYRFSEA